MPEITVRPGIPCPQTSSVAIVDRRLLTEGNHPRMQGRTIEIDERQVQSVTWALDTQQAAEFRAWWTDDLIYGGAWFSAPATWPTPEGIVVKVRRFVDAPSFQYLGVGHWLVSAVLEVRGASLLPQEPVPPETGGYDVIARTGALDSMTYGAQYLAEFPDNTGPIGVGLMTSGSQLEIYEVDESINGVRAPFDVELSQSTGSARSDFVDVDEELHQAIVAEFEIVSLPVGGRIAVGLYCSSIGPTGNLDDWLLGFPNFCTYWANDGEAGGYTGTSYDWPTFTVGDVIGFVAIDAVVFAFLNGVVIDRDPLGQLDTNNQAAFVSFSIA